MRPSSRSRPSTASCAIRGARPRWRRASSVRRAPCSRSPPRWPPGSRTRLLLVGDGPERAAIVADLARKKLTAAAHLTGSAAPRDVPALLTSMDAAVAPYADAKRFYFSPLKVYEYLASGRAVVASRVGQVAAIIQHEVNGLLCPPGDAGALADALQ